MNLKKEIKQSDSGKLTKDLLWSGIFSYICAICLLPSSGIVSTLPVPFLLAVACYFFCKTRWLIYIFFGTMPLLLNSLYGFPFENTLIVAVSSLISAYLGVLVKRAVLTLRYAKKKGDSERHSKSVAVVCVAGIVAAFVWLFVFGNPVSAVIKSVQNHNYTVVRYADTVNTSYTYYDVIRKQYLTKISFKGEPAGKDFYVSYPETDGYNEYCLQLISADAADYFERKTAIAAGDIKCYLDTEYTVLSPQSDYREYLKDFEYLIEISSEVTGLRGFRIVFENLNEYLSLPDNFEYKSITISAKDAVGNSYYAHLSYGNRVRYYYADENFMSEIDTKFYK